MTSKLVPLKRLGSQGLVVPAMGLGCMGMTAFYGNFSRADTEQSSLDTISAALELGINFLDTAWIYQSFGDGGGGNYTNEELIGKAIKIHGREKFIIASKFGIWSDPSGNRATRYFSGNPDFIRTQLQDSLQRLGTDYIDLYYQHRMDPSTPIEESMACLKELVAEGKIRYVGLSECTPAELRRAHAVHPISAIQMEWSLNTRDVEDAVVPCARQLGVGIVAYSPLGRGLLSGKITDTSALDQNDSRRLNGRFAEGNLQHNLATAFFALAEKRQVTPGQLALAWVMHRGGDVVPIPGSKSVARVSENAAAMHIALTAEECAEIEASMPPIAGDRYPGMIGSFNTRLYPVDNSSKCNRIRSQIAFT